jgi:hypothetical protein
MHPTHFKKLFNKAPIFNFYATTAQKMIGLKWFHGEKLWNIEQASELRSKGYGVFHTCALKLDSFESQSLKEFCHSAFKYLGPLKGEIVVSSSYDFEKQKLWLEQKILTTYTTKFKITEQI